MKQEEQKIIEWSKEKIALTAAIKIFYKPKK